MKKIFLTIIVLFIVNCYSQEVKYKFEVYLNDYNNPPTFNKVGNKLVYTGTNNNLKTFFENYTLLNFYQNTPISSCIMTF